MFAWTKPPMLPTTKASIDAYIDRAAPDARERLLAAYPDYPRATGAGRVRLRRHVRRARPGRSPTHTARMRRPTCTGSTTSASACGCSDSAPPTAARSCTSSTATARSSGRKMHPLGRRLQPSVGRRMQRAWLDFSAQGWETGEIEWSSGQDWPIYDTERRLTRIILSSRDKVVSDPDGGRRRGVGRPLLGRRRVIAFRVVAQVVEELLEQPRHHRPAERSSRAVPPHRWASSPSPRSDGSRRASARRDSPRRTPRCCPSRPR